MNRPRAAIGGLLAVMIAGARPAAGVQEKVFPYDKGPDRIDVSGYPEDQQRHYRLFARKCSKCHTLARPINSPYATPRQWRHYVFDRMAKKRRSNLDPESCERIVDFLSYDATVRKKDLPGRRRSGAWND